MKTLIYLIILLIPFKIFSQLSDNEWLLGSRSFNKDLTQYVVKEFIVNDLLTVSENTPINLGIDAVTSSGSGDLTTVIFSCKEQQKSGFIFGFWNDRINEFNLKYEGYAFLYLPIPKALDLFKTLNEVHENFDSKIDSNYGMEPNIVYKEGELTFVLYPDPGYSQPNRIRVFWKSFDSVWSINNMNLTIKRIEKTLRKE